jgi:uncharacterized membrane protein
MAKDMMQKTSQKQATHAVKQQGTPDNKSINISESESWISSIGGGLLIAYSLLRRDHKGLASALLGGGLIYRGLVRHSFLYDLLGLNTANADRPRNVERAVTIQCTPQEAYQCLRNIEQLPGIFPALKEVQVHDATHAHWVMRAPTFGKRSFSWGIEILREKSNEYITWQAHSTKSPMIYQGTIRFLPTPTKRGTEVKINVTYTLQHGHPFGKPLGFAVNQQIREDLRHLKAFLEAGEIPTIQGQPKGHAKAA